MTRPRVSVAIVSRGFHALFFPFFFLFVRPNIFHIIKFIAYAPNVKRNNNAVSDIFDGRTRTANEDGNVKKKKKYFAE